jgi:hypothetical protein
MTQNDTNVDRTEFTFEVDRHLLEFAQPAVDRLAYLFPLAQFELAGQSIHCSSPALVDLGTINEALRYELYRAKIRFEGQELRATLHAVVFQQ